MLKQLVKYLLLRLRFPKSRVAFSVAVDKKSFIGKHVVLFRKVVLQDSQVGDYSYIQENSVIVSCEIGRYCSIAGNVYIGLAKHPTNMVSTNPVFYDCTQPLPFFFTDKRFNAELIPKTKISADVWIGQGVMIKAGVHVGVGAVIGAGAVVVKDVQPYSIVAGVPAKHINWRFDEIIRKKLLESHWWELSEHELKPLAQFFMDPSQFIEMLSKIKKADDVLL